MALTVTNATQDGEPVTVRCADGRVAAIGVDVSPADGDDVIDAAGLSLLPTWVNGHSHASMTLFRGFGDDMPLMDWLQRRIWPAEARLTPDDVYWGARLGFLEMLRSGTSHVVDTYWHGEAVARAAVDAGIRATVSEVLIAPEVADRSILDRAEDTMLAIASHGPLVRAALGPHAVYTVGTEALEWVAECSARHDVPVQIHASETSQEVRDCVDAHGDPPVRYLDRLGLLTEHMVLGHGSWLEPDEFDLVAERGATVVTNPTSNFKLANGRTLPYPLAQRAGVALGLGTDGASSNNSLDMFAEAKMFSLVQKFLSDDATTASAAESLALARGQRSPLLGGTPLEAGAPADFMLADLGAAGTVPGDLDATLVYAATGHVVRTVVVDGRVVVRDRSVPDEEEILTQVAQRARRLRG